VPVVKEGEGEEEEWVGNCGGDEEQEQ